MHSRIIALPSFNSFQVDQHAKSYREPSVFADKGFVKMSTDLEVHVEVMADHWLPDTPSRGAVHRGRMLWVRR